MDEIRLKDAAEEDSVLTPTTPFVDAGAVWLDWIQRPEARPARGGLSERTKREYRSHYYRHIDAVGSPLRGRTIAQVNEPQRIILFLQRIADSSGNASAKMSRSVLSGILGLCLRRGVIRVNFAATIGAVSTATPKQSVRNRKRAFTRAERTEVLTHADALAQAATNLRTQRKWAATADLTGKACSPYGFHWAYDTHALAVGTGGALVEDGGDSWFFLTAEYAFGYSLEENTGAVVKEKGGTVVGSVRHPLAATDFSSFLLEAQSSGAKVVGLANAGLDTQNAIKQAAEFGIVQGGQRMAGLLFTLAEVHGLGLETAQGLTLTESFYWDRTEASREFANRFKERTGKMPNMVQAGTYSGVLHYLKAIEAAGTDETEAVAAKMRELPVSDAFAESGRVGPNGRMISDVYLMEVKTPAESKGEWDYYTVKATIPGDQAYLDPAKSGCPLVQ